MPDLIVGSPPHLHLLRLRFFLFSLDVLVDKVLFPVRLGAAQGGSEPLFVHCGPGLVVCIRGTQRTHSSAELCFRGAAHQVEIMQKKVEPLRTDTTHDCTALKPDLDTCRHTRAEHHF